MYDHFLQHVVALCNIVANLENPKCGRFFDFSFTLKRLMTNTLPKVNKCPSYKGVCLIEIIFNKNATLNMEKYLL